MLGQQQHVGAPSAQRRHVDLDHVDAEEQVLAEPLFFDGRLQVAIRGRQDPHVERHLLVAADRADLPFLQGPQQFGLHRQRHLADFVQQQRAAVGLQEQPLRSARASVKAPRAWPNNSLSSSVSGKAAQLTATNGCRAPPALLWIARATSSLPVPLSPVISTDDSASAIRVS